MLFFEFLFHETGIVNIALQFFHMDAIDFMHSQYAFWVLIILYVWKNCGYNVILFVAMLESVPKEYYEEASLQGAGSLAKMWYITLPVSVPYLFFILIISFVNSFKAFREAYVLFGNYPDNSIYMIQHFINNNFENINYTRISTSAVLVFHKGATYSYRHTSISSRSRRKASWICRPAVLRVRPICAPITRCGWRRK